MLFARPLSLEEMMSVWRYHISVLLLTALCSNVAEAKLIAGDCPTLPQLRQFPVKDGFKDIVGEIANDYQNFGILLLKDEKGGRLKSIETAHLQNPVDITVEVLRQWLHGSGRWPVTWQTLVQCLKEAKLNTAAGYIVDALPQEGSETPPSTIPQTPSTVAVAQRNIAMIKGRFATLVTTSCTMLQSKEISVDHVKMYLITMYSSPDTMDGSDTVNRVLESANCLAEICCALSKHGLWNYHNYYLLQNIIDKFGHDDTELKGMMKQYQRDLTGHILALQIPTYLDAINVYKDPTSNSENSTTDSEENIILTISPEKKHKLFSKLQVKVKVKITDHSISYVIDLWQSLTDQFVLPKPALILHSIAEGCIGITWLIPANLVKHLTKMVQERSSMFAKQHILKVMLEEHCIYPMEAEHELPPVESESIKRKKESADGVRNLEIPTSAAVGMVPIVVTLVIGILVILLVMLMVKKKKVENQHWPALKKRLVGGKEKSGKEEEIKGENKPRMYPSGRAENRSHVGKTCQIADGDYDDQVNLEDLGMLPVDKQWDSLGQALGVSLKELESIQESERTLKSRKSKMFRVWLQNDPAPTLDKLDSALERINETDYPSPGRRSRQSSTSAIYAEQGEVKWEGGELSNLEIKVIKERAAQEWERQKPNPCPARTQVRTWVPNGIVELAIGESGIEAEEPITVWQLFKSTVERLPLHPALKYKEKETWIAISYNEYYDLCIKAAKSFLKLGLERNHGVCIIGFNSPEWLISNLGAMFAGGLPTGIYTICKPEDCYFVAKDCKANIIVVENKKQMDKILEVWNRLPHLKAIVQYKGKLSLQYRNVYEWEEFLKLGDNMKTSVVMKKIMSQKPDQCALLIYTSGTTGNPKGVMLSHDNLTFTARAVKETYERLEHGQEWSISYLPLSHISAQGSIGETLRDVQPTFFFGVPRVYEKIMERVQEQEASAKGLRRVIFQWAKTRGYKGSLRMMESRSKPIGWRLANYLVFKKVREALGFNQCKIFVVGADTVHMDVLNYFMSIDIQLMELYGLSECSGCFTLNLIQRDGWKVGSCGKTIKGVQRKIFNPDRFGKGEICIKGRNVFMGYLNNEGKTKEAIDDDGWLHSGDIGKFKISDGFLDFIGRIDDLIGMSEHMGVHPKFIEDKIKSEIPFLSNVMVVGDGREYLTCLMTLKCEMDPDTGEPLDTLTPKAKQLIQNLGSHNTKLSEILGQQDKAVFTAIQKGLDKVNIFLAQVHVQVQKWNLLDKDFSIPGGELGPTLKVRRHFVHRKYRVTIDAMFSDS